MRAISGKNAYNKKGKKKSGKKREEEIIRSVCCLCSIIIIYTQYATLGLLLYSAASTLTFNRRVSIVYIMLIINFANKLINITVVGSVRNPIL